MNQQAYDIIQSWLDVAEQNRGTECFRVSLAAFRSIVTGHKPTIAEIGAAIDMPVADLDALVQQMTSEGRLRLDDAGEAMAGAGGLSLVESRHVLDMLGRRFWAWCALDAVGIPAGLDAGARVHSRCADTGEPVEIDIEAGTLQRSQPSDVVLSLIPPMLNQSLHDCCCSEIGFFADPNRVPPPAVPVTVAEAMQLGSKLWRDGIPF